MSTVPEISVLMPVYNGARYLDQAVRSVLEQCGPSLELIVLDDGSCDATLQILERWKSQDGRVRIEQLAHGGIVKALNRGIELARGRYLARMDADDKMAFGRLEQQHAFAQAHPDHLIGTQALLCDPRLRTLGLLNPPAAHEAIVASCLAGMASALMHPTLFGSRALFEQLEGYRESYRHIEDLDLYLRAARQGFRLANLVQTPLLHYRLHAQSVSNQKNQLQMTLKRQLLQEFEQEGSFQPDWEGLERAATMLPKTRPDFYRRWAVIAMTHQQKSLARRYLLRSLVTPPISASKSLESLKLLKGSFQH